MKSESTFVQIEHNPGEPLPDTGTDWARVDAFTEEELHDNDEISVGPVLFQFLVTDAGENSTRIFDAATLEKKMKATKEGDSNLLDNSMIVYGAGLSDGNRHTHEDLPTLIAGRGGNYLKPGRRIVYRKETPMCNLFLTMMDRMGVHVDDFGDSTGRLEGLDLA